jgi:hypothetical protein
MFKSKRLFLVASETVAGLGFEPRTSLLCSARQGMICSPDFATFLSQDSIFNQPGCQRFVVA